jgi:hypothetical protein
VKPGSVMPIPIVRNAASRSPNNLWRFMAQAAWGRRTVRRTTDDWLADRYARNRAFVSRFGRMRCAGSVRRDKRRNG